MAKKKRKKSTTKDEKCPAPTRRMSTRIRGEAPKTVESSDVVTPQMYTMRSAFANYLIHAADNAAAADNNVTCLTIQGHHKSSLSLELQLCPRQYAAILIGCGLVEKHGNIVRCNNKGWDDFFEKYQLKNKQTNTGVCDKTLGGIKYNELGLGKIDDDNHLVQLDIVQLGRCKTKGEVKSNIATQLINRGEDSPNNFSVSLRTWHRRLFNEINEELATICREQKDFLDLVEDWVLMKDIRANMEAKMEGTRQSTPTSLLEKPTQPPGNKQQVKPTSKQTPPATKQPPPQLSHKSPFLPPPDVSMNKNPFAASALPDFSMLQKMPDLSANQVQILERMKGLLQAFVEDSPINHEGDLKEAASSTPSSKALASTPPVQAVAATPSPNKTSPKDIPKLLSAVEQLIPLQKSTAGFDTGRMNQENLLRELVQTMQKDPKGASFESINSMYHYEVATFRSRMNDKSSMDVDEGFKQLFDAVGDEKSDLVNGMIRYLVSNHREETIEALRAEKLVPKVMSEFDFIGVRNRKRKASSIDVDADNVKRERRT